MNTRKRWYFLFLLIGSLFFTSSRAQTSIELVSKGLGFSSIEKVEIFDLSQREFYELPYKDLLNFTFSKTNIDCYNIRYSGKNIILRQQVWLEPGQVKISTTSIKKKLIIDSVSGAKVYDDHQAFKNRYRTLIETKDTVSANKLLLDKFNQYIKSPYSLAFADLYINLNQNDKTELLKLAPLLAHQNDEFKWFFLYPVVTGSLKRLLAIRNLDYTKYTFYDLQGKKTKLHATNRKFLILDFWFLSCIPCIRDHKLISSNLEYLEKRNAEILSISIDKDIEKWRSYVLINNYVWRNYQQAENTALTRDLNISAFPNYIIVNSNNEVLSIKNSFSDVIQWLDDHQKDSR